MTLHMPMRLSVLACLCGFVAVRAQNPQPANPPGQQRVSAVIEGIEFSGTSRAQPGTLGAAIRSKVGDVYDEAVLRRDLATLWNTNRFTDIQVKKETGARGGVVVRFVVTERREAPLSAFASNVIEKIEFSGISRASSVALLETIRTKVGDVYDEDSLRRDFTALWNTHRFTDIQLKKETGERRGVFLRFVVNERTL